MTKRTLPCLLLLVLLFSGCSKYGFVNLNYPLSPANYFPENIKTITLVNRSLTKDQDKKNNVIEAIVTSEVAGSDRLASDECLKAVFDQLNGYNGLSVVIPGKTRLYGTGTRETPELLDWNLVQSICDSNHSDALLVLETFDSNSDLLVTAVTQQVGNIITSGTVKPSVPNQIKMTVIAYWRLYDPSSKTIVDQYQSTSFLTFEGTGANFAVPPPEALPGTAYAAGQEYARRFLPSYYTVHRDMYKKGSGKSKQAFKLAFRHAEMAKWDDAIADWTEIEKSSNRKTAGRACVDIAVAHEVLGNTDLALQWAQRSYELYNNKLGRDYAKILLNRQSIEH